eukprot:2080328-Amphidinium_carterae.1
MTTAPNTAATMQRRDAMLDASTLVGGPVTASSIPVNSSKLPPSLRCAGRDALCQLTHSQCSVTGGLGGLGLVAAREVGLSYCSSAHATPP